MYLPKINSASNYLIFIPYAPTALYPKNIKLNIW